MTLEEAHTAHRLGQLVLVRADGEITDIVGVINALDYITGERIYRARISSSGEADMWVNLENLHELRVEGTFHGDPVQFTPPTFGLDIIRRPRKMRI